MEKFEAFIEKIILLGPEGWLKLSEIKVKYRNKTEHTMNPESQIPRQKCNRLTNTSTPHIENPTQKSNIRQKLRSPILKFLLKI